MSMPFDLTDVGKAERVVASLEQKRAACVARGTELMDERAGVALAAHTGDAQARQRLDEINSAIATHGSELASIDAALKAAAEHVAVAQHAAALTEDRAAARQLGEELERFLECGQKIDAALAIVIDVSHEMQRVLYKMNALGGGPSTAQLASLGERALLAALGQTAWRRSFQVIAPNQRHGFAELVTGWRGPIERNIKQRLALGEQQDEQQPNEAA